MMTHGEQQDRIKYLEGEVKRLNDLINRPHIGDFFDATRIEIAHQQKLWYEHDKDKPISGWFWTVVYLAAKAYLGDQYRLRRLAHARFRAWDICQDAVNRAYDKVETKPYLSGREAYDKIKHRIVTIAAAAFHWHDLGVKPDDY